MQGHVVSTGREGSNGDLILSDGSGPTLTVCLRHDLGLPLPEPGEYVLLVGRLCHRRIPGEPLGL